MHDELDTFAAALFACTDDFLTVNPQLAPWRPAVGLVSKLMDADMVTVAVLQALSGSPGSGAGHALRSTKWRQWFPDFPSPSGYNKRLRHLGGTLQAVFEYLGRDTGLWADVILIADSTPGGCGRSRETARAPNWRGGPKRGIAPGIQAGFRGLRVHLLGTLSGLTVGCAMTGAKTDECEALPGVMESMPASVGATGGGAAR